MTRLDLGISSWKFGSEARSKGPEFWSPKFFGAGMMTRRWEMPRSSLGMMNGDGYDGIRVILGGRGQITLLRNRVPDKASTAGIIQ
jgi:hypothetical protein